MGVTFWERLNVTALQAKLGEGGDLAEDGVGLSVLGQGMAVTQVQVRKGCQFSEAFGQQTGCRSLNI